MLTSLSRSSSTPPESAPSLAVVLLEANSVSTVRIGQGVEGGRAVARKIHQAVEEKLVSLGAGQASVMVYLIGSGNEGPTMEDFLAGFSSATIKCSLAVPPASGREGSLRRIKQLASTFLSFPFVSHVFLPTPSSQSCLDDLTAQSDEKRDKVILIVTSLGESNPAPGEDRSEVLRIERLLREDGEDAGAAVSQADNGNVEGDEVTNQSVKFQHSNLFPAPSPIEPGPFKVPKMVFHEGTPCRDFYLNEEGCKHCNDCRFMHNYPFTPAEWKQYPLYIKSMRCPIMLDHGECPWGDVCYMGHVCPKTRQTCWHLEHGICEYEIAGLPHAVEPDFKGDNDGTGDLVEHFRRGSLGEPGPRPYRNSRCPWKRGTRRGLGGPAEIA